MITVRPDDEGRAAFAELFNDDPPADEAPPPDPRPQRPGGSIDQGMRGTHHTDPRQDFADALRRSFR